MKTYFYFRIDHSILERVLADTLDTAIERIRQLVSGKVYILVKTKPV